MEQSPEYYDDKWAKVAKAMPKGGDYRFDQRRNGYKIICDYIGENKRVFDFACGLGVIGGMLGEQGCQVNGCDYSQFAVNYAVKHYGGDFRCSDKIWGDSYDYIIACYFLEHIKDPVGWLREMLKHGKKVICSIPNDFRRHGEHSDMAWKDWETFYELFSPFDVVRIDEDKWESSTQRAWRHPTFVFSIKKGKVIP
jgi:2-polyprenyl-3-methyl-5-hydroxy-6-metoxy-1,4-benzoquinol methylase